VLTAYSLRLEFNRDNLTGTRLSKAGSVTTAGQPSQVDALQQAIRNDNSWPASTIAISSAVHTKR